jgi:Lipid A 3-O-deacylase (PagL)
VYARKQSIVLILAPLLFAFSAFAQTGDQTNQSDEEKIGLASEKQISAAPTLVTFEDSVDQAATPAPWDVSLSASRQPLPQSDASLGESPDAPGNKSEEDSGIQPSNQKPRRSQLPDFNRDIYYFNKLEFSFDVGWLPINIPFPFDFATGDAYNLYPLHYTLVPILASLRWQVDDLAGPLILRGNWDISFSASATLIPRGPETRYFAYIMGFRRNFVPRNSRLTGYWDARMGLGDINAKGPDGVKYAQGQDFTFTLNMGSGFRYNFNPRYAFSAGLNWMHVSNANLSEGNGKPDWGVINYGINVLGPVFGIDIQLRKHPRQSE